MENDNTDKALIVYEPVNSDDQEINNDIEEARKTYKQLIKKGKKGLKFAVDLIEASEHPRAIEVFSGLLDSIAAINEKLLNLQKTKKEIKNPKDQSKIEGTTNNTNNTIFIGSPADLQKMLRGE